MSSSSATTASGPYLDYVSIAREEMVLVVPEEHPLLGRPFLPRSRVIRMSPTEPGPVPLCGRPSQAHDRAVHPSAVPAVPYPARIVLEVSTLHSYTAVAQNIGIGIRPPCPPHPTPPATSLPLLDDPQNLQWSFAAITRSQVSTPGRPGDRQMAQRVYQELSEKL